MISKNKLKQLEERVERVIEDPIKIIQIVKRIIDMAYPDTDGSMMNPPIPENQKVTLLDFVKYFGNYNIERAEENGWDVEKTKKDFNFVEAEKRIRDIGGFSDETLPDGIVIKYQ